MVSTTSSASESSLVLPLESISIWVVTDSVDSPSCYSKSSLATSRNSLKASATDEWLLGFWMNS
ncbi:hypothetical protein A2U01_0023872, partial [Trifolium medium]|nr:hypothetical protein [Trifolium medium]